MHIVHQRIWYNLVGKKKNSVIKKLFNTELQIVIHTN